MNFLLNERKGKLKDYFFGGRQKLRWPTSKPMQALQDGVSHQINTITDSSSQSIMAR